MKYIEKYANYLDSEGTAHLFDKLQKEFGNKLEPTAAECGIAKASVYGWRARKEDVKHSTKVKVLETLIEKLPLETFYYLTDKLYNSSSETLMSYLSTLYEQSFDAKDEDEYLKTVRIFENMVKEYAGLIYKNRDLEVNKLFLTMNDFAKSKNFHWIPQQTILLEYTAMRMLIPQMVASWIYPTFPHSLEELTERGNLPLDIVQDVHDELNKQILSMPLLSDEDISSRMYIGLAAANLPRKIEYQETSV
ncbi:MAG: hypothetical protein IIA82_08420 [Thaumarchaeota archaeon]|nr:hypothetical protein [Nitrososphaerota archaeon]